MSESAFPKPPPPGRGHRIAPPVFAAAIGIVYLVLTIWILARTVHDPVGRVHFTEKDSAQYVSIAKMFAAGDFSMAYVKNRPHRQPLYPMLLAPAMKLGGGALFPLGLVNIVAGLLTLLSLYYGSLKLFEDHGVVAALVSVTFVANFFMIDLVGRRIMTEPLHVFFMVLIVIVFVLHLREPRNSWRLFLGGLSAMDYLTRPNGLFVMLALVGTLLPYEVWLLLRGGHAPGDSSSTPRRLARLAGSYALAILVFILVSSPSWWPRWQRWGNPIEHGYLSNYMFVDTYDEGHTGKPQEAFTWRDYAARHTTADFLRRWGHGFRQVWFKIPFVSAQILYLCAVAGLCVAFVKRDAAYMMLALFAFVQSLPLVWTNLSNPNQRVPYAAVLPFEWIYAGVFFLWLARYLTARRRPAEAPAPASALA